MQVAIFALSAGVSLGASVVLVSRLERVGERLGVSEALLGLLAALAADGPEITSSVTAIAGGHPAVGIGVTLLQKQHQLVPGTLAPRPCARRGASPTQRAEVTHPPVALFANRAVPH